MFFTFWLRNVLCATTACTFSTAQLPKVFRTWNAFELSHLQMCFALQRRALFRHLNGVFSFFTCKYASRHNGIDFFDISNFQKVVRMWGVFSFFTCKCASRHNGVHLFRHLNFQTWSGAGCFVHFDFEMCFAPQRRAICYLSCGQMAPHPPLWRAYFSTLRSHKSWINTVFRDFPTFSRTCIFFPLTLSLLWSSLFCSSLFYSSLLYSSLLSDSAHLCFSSVHTVGSLTSKLPSTTTTT